MSRKLNTSEQHALDRMVGRTSLEEILTGLSNSYAMHLTYARDMAARFALQEDHGRVLAMLQTLREKTQ